MMRSEGDRLKQLEIAQQKKKDKADQLFNKPKRGGSSQKIISGNTSPKSTGRTFTRYILSLFI
jgi:hypothetical protein